MSRRLFPTIVVASLLAAACGSGGGPGDPVSAGTAADGSDGPVSSAAPSGPCVLVDGVQGPVGTPQAQIASTPREDVPSALEAFDESFPEPLVDLDRIISGGPPPDGIPPIDRPCFVPVAEATHVSGGEAVVVLELGGEARAYPISILTYHEIVNDAFGATPVTVTYCPLCSSAVAYDRRLGERILDFGTSGRLYNSALVMYDRQTQSLWSHFTGQAIVGALTGAELDVYPMNTVSMSDFASAHPDGLVLTAATGHRRNYGVNPYAGYDDEDNTPFLFDGDAPDDEAALARVIGVASGEERAALRHEDVYALRVVPFELDGRSLVAWILPGTASPLEDASVAGGRDIGGSGVYDAEVDGRVLSFVPTDGGFVDAETGSTWTVLGEAVDGPLAGTRLEPVEHLDTFWFAWTAFHPDTTVVEPTS